MKYQTRLRLRDSLRRRGGPPIISAVLWLAWALVALALANLYGDFGLLLALILLGGIVFMALAVSLLWLRRQVRQDRQRENEFQNDLIWLSAKVGPRKPFPLWAGGMAHVDLLDRARELILDSQPRRILELGSGLSSLVMAYALEANGRGQLFSLEDNAAHAQNTNRMLAKHSLGEYARVLDAPLRDLDYKGRSYQWYSLDDLPADGDFELLFIDGPAGYLAPNMRFPALPVLRRRLTPGALILVDDTDRERERLMIEEWLLLFPEIERDDNASGAGFTALRVSGGVRCPQSKQNESS